MTRTLRFLRSRWGWLAICLVTGMLLSLTRGLDNWWDLLNYHIYNPWALLHHRENVDLFAAGIQGYFDPLLDIPYYLIAFVWFPNHPAIVAALTGLPFGLLLFVTLLLVRNVLAPLTASMSPVARWTITLITLVMAVSGVSTWSQAFTTTNEVMVSAIVLGALVLLIGAFAAGPHYRHLSPRRAFAVGSLLGVAAGLKLTATVYAPAAGLLLLASHRNWKATLRNGVVFFTAWVLTFAIVFGPWALHLYRQTGNPLFPMFNNLFHSPLGTGSAERDTRFLPSSIEEWLFAPFYWLSDKDQTVFPLFFRDARFALVYLLGIPAAFLSFRSSRDDSATKSSALFALLGVWIIGYAVWLTLFSMLRYAIVLEVSASILAIGSMMSLLRRLASRWRQIIHVGFAAILAMATISFACIPKLGQIPIESQTFQARVPVIGKNALIILANEPMGLLAPEIEGSAQGATFIGIPSCFAADQWCYTSFFHSGLGRLMREKVASHHGPLYVAYYADRTPTLAQLGLFRVAVNDNACQTMQTNRTADVLLCDARYTPDLPADTRASLRFKLSVQTRYLDPGFVLKSTWITDPCDQNFSEGALAFDWHAPNSATQIQVFVVSAPASHSELFSQGGATGHAATGPWVAAAQRYVFTDQTGHQLARSTIHYVACPNN